MNFTITSLCIKEPAYLSKYSFALGLNDINAWSPYSCNANKHSCEHVSDSVPSSFDTREHFDYNITSLTSCNQLFSFF